MSCANLSEKELGSEKETWYVEDCIAECGICSGDVLYNHKAVQCDKCEMWVHNDCSFVTISSMKLCKIQAVPGFVRNVNFSTSQTHSFLSN